MAANVTSSSSNYSTNKIHNGSYLCYFNGIEVPVQTVTVRYGVWQMPEATIEMVPDPILQRIGAEDRIQVAIFYLDDFLSDAEEDKNWCLLFEGEIVGWGYQATKFSRNISFTAVNQIAIFTQLFIHYLNNLDEGVSAATNQIENNAATITVADSEITFPTSLFTQGLVDPTKSKPIKRPFDYMYNIIKAMIGKFDRKELPDEVRDKVRRQKSVPAANFFSRWGRVTNFHNRFVATPIFDENDKDAIFPILNAFQKTVAIDTIIKSILPRIQEAGSMWDMLKMVYDTVFMEIAMIPTAPFVKVNLETGSIEPTEINAVKLTTATQVSDTVPNVEADIAAQKDKLDQLNIALEQVNKAITLTTNAKREAVKNKDVLTTNTNSLSSSLDTLKKDKTELESQIEQIKKNIVTLNKQLKRAQAQENSVYIPPVDYDPQHPWRLANYFTKPQLLFGLPPSCNVLFPSQIDSFSYQENFATQPTRLYFNDTVLPDIMRMAGNVRTTALSALAIAYPPEADTFNKQRILNNQAGASGKNFLLFPEEFFKGPVEDRRIMPAWFFMLQQTETTTDKQEAENNTTVTQNTTSTTNTSNTAPGNTTIPSTNVSAGVQFVNQSGDTGGTAQITVGSTTLEGPKRSFRPYTLSKNVANNTQLRQLLELNTQGTDIPVNFLLAWIDRESGGNNRSDTGAPGPRAYHTAQSILQEPWKSLNDKAVSAGNSPPFRIGMYKYDPTKGQSPLDEHGYFQVSYAESKSLGLSDIEHEQILSDPTISVKTGIKLVQRYQAKADQLQQQYGTNFSKKSSDYWKLVKGLHALPSAITGALAYAKAQLGRAPANWNEMLSVALSAAVYTPRSGPGGANVYSPAEGKVWNTDLKKNVTWPIRLLNADAVGNYATFTASESAAITQANTPNAGVSTTGAAEQTVASTSTAATADEDAAPNIYQLYAEYEFFRERYSQRQGSVVTVFNPYVLPGFPGMIFDNRDSAVDVWCYFISVQHTLSQRGHQTSISFSHGRTFTEVIDTLKTKFDATIGNSGLIAIAPKEPILEIKNVIQQFPKAEEFYQALLYKRSAIENKTAAFWWPDVVGYSVPGDSTIVENIFIDGVTNSQVISNDDKIAALTVEKNSLLDSINKGLVATQELRQSISSFNRELASVTDLNSRTNITNVLIVFENQLEQLQNLIAQQQVRVEEIDKTLASISLGLVKHNLDPTRSLVPLELTESLFTNYDAAMFYNWRPICTLEEYIAFYNSIGENIIPAHGTSLSVGKPFYERIRRLRPLTSATKLPTGADGIILASSGSISNQKIGTASVSTDASTETAGAQGTAGSVLGPTAVGLDKNFPQSREDWDSALLSYRDNVYNVSPPRR